MPYMFQVKNESKKMENKCKDFFTGVKADSDMFILKNVRIFVIRNTFAPTQRKEIFFLIYNVGITGHVSII